MINCGLVHVLGIISNHQVPYVASLTGIFTVVGGGGAISSGGGGGGGAAAEAGGAGDKKEEEKKDEPEEESDEVTAISMLCGLAPSDCICFNTPWTRHWDTTGVRLTCQCLSSVVLLTCCRTILDLYVQTQVQWVYIQR